MNYNKNIRSTDSTSQILPIYECTQESEEFTPYKFGRAARVVLVNNRKVRLKTEPIDCSCYQREKESEIRRYRSYEEQLLRKNSSRKVINMKRLQLLSVNEPSKNKMNKNSKQSNLQRQKRKLQMAIKQRKPNFFSNLNNKDQLKVKKHSRILNLGIINSSNIFLSHYQPRQLSSVKNLPISKKQLRRIMLVNSVSTNKYLIQFPKISSNKSFSSYQRS